VAVLVRRRNRRPPTWAHQVAADLGRAGARLGCTRRPDETLTGFGARLARAAPAAGSDIAWVCRLVEGATYGGTEPSAEDIRRALETSRRIRSLPRRRARAGHPGDGPRGPSGGGTGGGSGGGGVAGQPRAWASASSNEAPAASNGR
jgi:hypothetical protein